MAFGQPQHRAAAQSTRHQSPLLHSRIVAERAPPVSTTYSAQLLVRTPRTTLRETVSPAPQHRQLFVSPAAAFRSTSPRMPERASLRSPHLPARQVVRDVPEARHRTRTVSPSPVHWKTSPECATRAPANVPYPQPPLSARGSLTAAAPLSARGPAAPGPPLSARGSLKAGPLAAGSLAAGSLTAAARRYSPPPQLNDARRCTPRADARSPRPLDAPRNSLRRHLDTAVAAARPAVPRRETARAAEPHNARHPAAQFVQRRSTFLAEPVTQTSAEKRRHSPFQPVTAAPRPQKTVSAKNLNDPELLGSYHKASLPAGRPSPRGASRGPAGSPPPHMVSPRRTAPASPLGAARARQTVEIYRPAARRAPLGAASFQPQVRRSIGVPTRTQVRRSHSYTHLHSSDTSDSLKKEHTEQSTNAGEEPEAPSPSSPSIDDAVKDPQELALETAANPEPEKVGVNPPPPPPVETAPSEETTSRHWDLETTPPIAAAPAPTGPPVPAPTVTPRTTLRGVIAVPSVPAAALLTPRQQQLTPRREGPVAAPVSPVRRVVHVPGPAGRPASRPVAPLAVPYGMAPVVAQSSSAGAASGVRSELQRLKGYAAQLQSTVGDKQAQLAEAVTRHKDLVEGDQIIAESCAGVHEELHRIRSYAATLSTVVEDRQVVTELAKMSDFAKELENFLPHGRKPIGTSRPGP